MQTYKKQNFLFHKEEKLENFGIQIRTQKSSKCTHKRDRRNLKKSKIENKNRKECK